MADKELKRGSDGYYRIRFLFDGKQYSVRGKTLEELYGKKAEKLNELERGKEESQEPRKGSDGYYRLRFTYEGKQYSIRAKTLQELGAKKQQKLDALERGEDRLDKTTLVKQWAQIWLDTYVRPKVRKPGAPKDGNSMTEKSFSVYTDQLRVHILPEIGNYRLKDVTSTHLQRLMNTLAGRNESTVKKTHRIIKAMFREAYRARIIPYDPADGLQLPYTTRGHRRAMNEEEYRAFQMAAEISPHGLWFRVLLGTGIRPGEGYALQVKDFDFMKGLLNIDKALESGTKVVSMPKTKAGIRKVPIPSDLMLPLQLAFKGRDPEEIAFPQADGISMKSASSGLKEWYTFHRTMDICAGARTIHRGTILTMEKDGYKRASGGRIMDEEIDGTDGHVLPQDLDMYCLRHTYCTNLQKAGVDMYTAKYLMGHESIETTAKIYTHSGEHTALAAAEKINAWTMEMAK